MLSQICALISTRLYSDLHMKVAAHSWRIVALAAGQSSHRKARAFPARQHRVSCHAVNIEFVPQQCNACAVFDQQHTHLDIEL